MTDSTPKSRVDLALELADAKQPIGTLDNDAHKLAKWLMVGERTRVALANVLLKLVALDEQAAAQPVANLRVGPGTSVEPKSALTELREMQVTGIGDAGLLEAERQRWEQNPGYGTPDTDAETATRIAAEPVDSWQKLRAAEAELSRTSIEIHVKADRIAELLNANTRLEVELTRVKSQLEPMWLEGWAASFKEGVQKMECLGIMSDPVRVLTDSLERLQAHEPISKDQILAAISQTSTGEISERLRAAEAELTRCKDDRETLLEQARAEYDRGRRDGREDVGKYANAIGRIDCAIGLVGARPLDETVGAVESMQAELTRVKELLSDREDQLRVADRTVANLVAAKDEFEKRGAEAERKLRTAVEDCEHAVNGREAALQELTRVKEENARLSGELEKQAATVHHAKEDAKHWRSERDKTDIENDAQRAKLAEAERTIAGLREQIRIHEPLSIEGGGATYWYRQASRLSAVVAAAVHYHASGDQRECEALGEALSALDQPATPPESPDSSGEVTREIKVGSTWLDASVLGPSHSVTVDTVHDDGGGVNLLKDTGWRFSMTTIAFRHAYRWLSDPTEPPAERPVLGSEETEPVVGSGS